MEQNVNWDEGIDANDKWIRLEADEPKEITLTNWRFQEREVFKKQRMEFVADVVEEDGQDVEKEFTTVSNPLKKKLRPILEGKEPTEKVKIRLIKTEGSSPTDTRYSVKEI